MKKDDSICTSQTIAQQLHTVNHILYSKNVACTEKKFNYKTSWLSSLTIHIKGNVYSRIFFHKKDIMNKTVKQQSTN